jgi:NAD(P)-dependent dehydrogenase (short-subunit alcohol dehydrogenase family)
MAGRVLITGATRGLGLGMARHFAARGYALALTGRKQEELDQLQKELAGGEPVITKVLEITDYDAIGPCIRECAAELGGLDIIVANAGVGFDTPTGKGSFATIRQTIDINITGAIATCEAAIELFREQGHGQLVGITSIAKLRGNKGRSAYCSSKAAVSVYLESVRCDTFDEPIVVTELAPGYIDTDLNKDIEKRPFLVSAEKGTGIMVDLIEKQVEVSYVPPWPWKAVAAVLKRMPTKKLKDL